MEWTLAALCEYLHGELIGNGSTIIRDVDGFEGVQKDEVTFADNPRRLAGAMATQAAAIIVSREVNDLAGRHGIRVEDPKLAFALLLALFHPEASPAVGVHATAVLGENVRLGDAVSIGAHAVIGRDVVIGRGTRIESGVHVGDGVTIGEGCVLDSTVVVYRGTLMGDRVMIHAGSVIGGDGFGYVFHEGRYVKIPQVGNVVIEDDVEIGCNTCVDRAAIGSTVIQRGTKIDNQVQIAHNDRIGRHVIIAGQVGLAGSVVVGDYVVMGGRAGAVDHVTIGERAKVGAASIVTKRVTAGDAVWGYPARSARNAKRQLASLSRLPSILKSLTRLVERMRQTEARVDRLEQERR